MRLPTRITILGVKTKFGLRRLLAKLVSLRLRTKILLGIALVVVIGIIIFIRLINGSANGTISQTKTPATTPISNLTADGKTFSFSYPNSFHQIPADSLSAQDIEKFSLLSPQTSPWHIDIQIRKLPSGNITDDSSYKLRKLNPQQYAEQVVTINGNDMYVLTDITGGYNKIVFTVDTGRIASIAVTSNSATDSNQLDLALNQVIKTWKWR